MVSAEDIIDAHDRIRPYIRTTSVLREPAIDIELGCELYFKCEHQQEIGAFKVRGAVNTVLQIQDADLQNGIVTHSSGNHAQAVAYAAKIKNIQSYIVMPSNALDIKKRGVIRLGGKIIECKPTLEAREEMLNQVALKTGAVEVHPFNDYRIIAGQATAAKELIEEQPGLDYLLVPVGGGGLLSGTCLSVNNFSPSTRVIAGEPTGADDAFRSMQTLKIEVSQGDTVADGLRTSLGTKTFPIIRDHVHRIITVTDTETISAMKFFFDRTSILIEPSSAVPLAALIKEKSRFSNRSVGIILTGGNVEEPFARGLFERLAQD